MITLQDASEMFVFIISLLVAILSCVLYWLEGRKTKELQRQLGDKLLEKHERENVNAIQEYVDNRSESELFNEAVRRGLKSKVSKPSGDQGSK